MIRLLLSAVLLSAAPLRALDVAPVRGSIRGPVAPEVAAGWAKNFNTFFSAPKVDAFLYQDTMLALYALDHSDPDVRRSLKPVAAELRAAAETLLAAKNPRLDKLAALIQAQGVIPAEPRITARLAEQYRAMSDARQKRFADRLNRWAFALADASRDAAIDPVVVLPDAPNVPLDRRVVVVYVVKEEGRRGSGKDQAKPLKRLVARYPGKIRILDRDREAISTYMSILAFEIAPSAREAVMADLAKIEGLGAVPLETLVKSGLAKGDAARAQDLAQTAKDLQDPDLARQMTALSDLLARLDSMSRDEVAKIPEAERDAVVHALLHTGWSLKTAYEMVRQSQDNVIRVREYEKRGKDKDFDQREWEEMVFRMLADPAITPRFMPMRALFTRVLTAMDRLETRDSREHLLAEMGEATHAGFELAAADPQRKLRFFWAWVDMVSSSVKETMFGLREGKTREEKWSGSNSSGGYEHVEGRRQDTFLFEWRPYRVNPGDLRTEAQLLLGVPGMNGHLVNLVVETLASVQADVAILDATNRESHVKRALAKWEEQAGPNIEKAREEGRPIPQETIDKMRENAREQASDEYDRYYQVTGHGIVARFIGSLYYAPYFARTIPGYKEAVYIDSVLKIFQKALERVDEPGMVKQLMDSALSFLSNVKDETVLDERPELRTQAVALWKTISAKAEAQGVGLITKLDGVIDVRAQVNPKDPKLFEGDKDKYATVWQVAASADGKYVARAGGDRLIKVWERATGKLVKTIKLEDARQHYGDLDNSLGVTFVDGGVLVATLHDVEEQGKRSSSYQLVRLFGLEDAKAELGPEDAKTTLKLDGVNVLRDFPVSKSGVMRFVAETRRYSQDGSFNRWSGSDIQVMGVDGKSGRIDDYRLLSTQQDLVLGARVSWATPEFGIFDVSDAAAPKDVTPAWLKQWAQLWTQRQTRSEYGYWPWLSARLGAANGKPAVLIDDEGKVKVYDLATGTLVREFDLPPSWEAPNYATDKSGTKLAVLTEAPGRLYPKPQRVIVWDLKTGKMLFERAAEGRAQLLWTDDGLALVTAGKGRTELVPVP